MPEKVEPYIPASKSLPELTLGVILLGSLLSVILAGANAYLGMFAGMTVSASVPAAVISMALLRALRTGNILQNNAVQTAAASGEGLAAGVIFTLPALVLLGTWARFSYLETTLIAGFGGILGVLFTIPLRRALIIEQPLQFPEGVATAEVLKVGAEGGGGVGTLVIAGVIAAVVKIGSTGFQLWNEVVESARWITEPVTAIVAGRAVVAKAGVPFYMGLNASPALLAVGAIVGINVAAVIMAGAAINRWVAVPLFALLGDPSRIATDRERLENPLPFPGWHWDTPKLLEWWSHTKHIPLKLNEILVDTNALDTAGAYHKYVTRYLGVGGMLVGGIWSLIKLRKSLLGGITAGLAAYRQKKAGGGDVPRTERDMPMNFILIAIAASVVPLFFIFWHFVSSPLVAAVMAVVMIVAGFLFSAVASYMAGLVGSSNNPVSGITISTILVSALLLLALGVPGDVGPVAAILIGGVVCCAAAIGGDNLQDLKCGQLVGSTPWKQQVMQIIGVVVAAFTMAPVLNLLNDAYHIGSKNLPAPQANLMGSVAHSVFEGGMPWGVVAIGAGLAVAVILIDSVLEAKKSKIGIPVMAFAVGVYLPFELNVPIFLGGLIAWGISRKLRGENATEERKIEVERNGLLAAAGFITGEALMGIVIAIPVAIAGDANVLAMSPGTFVALGAVALTLILLYRLAVAKPER